jgi:hypothetical protein
MSGIRERHILRSQPKLNNIRSYGPRQPQRYFASDLDPLSSRLFDASGIEAVEVVWEFTR